MPTQKFVSDVCRNFVHNCQTWKKPRYPIGKWKNKPWYITNIVIEKKCVGV